MDFSGDSEDDDDSEEDDSEEETPKKVLNFGSFCDCALFVFRTCEWIDLS